MDYQDKTLGFASELVPLVQSGEKTLTYRLGDKWNFLNPGDSVLTSDSATGEVFGKLRIALKEETKFGELPIDRPGHEIYQSVEDKKTKFTGYYGREIEDTEPITILGFTLEEAN